MLSFWFRSMLLALSIFAFSLPFTLCQAKTRAMTIAMPEEVILQSLQDILPLKIDKPSKYVEGGLILNSISKLVMGDNSAILKGVIVGKKLSVITRVGDRDLRIKIGNLELPLTCDLTFRYDSRRKVLYFIPHIRRPEPRSANDMARSVTSLLTLFNNREYPISLTSLKTLDARVGDQDISVDMEPVDIRVSKGQLIVKMVPRITKTN